MIDEHIADPDPNNPDPKDIVDGEGQLFNIVMFKKSNVLKGIRAHPMTNFIVEL